MADAALGIAGVALAIPGVVDLLFKYAEWIRERTKVYRNAKGVWEEMGQFAGNLASGELGDWVKLAGSFCTQRGGDTVLKNSLELNLRKLAAHVAETKLFLERNHPGHVFERLLFTVSGERRARELNRNLAQDKQELAQILVINYIHTQQFPNTLLLTAEDLVFYQSYGYHPIPGTSNLFTARGDLRDQKGAYRETDLITERFAPEENVSADTLQAIARLIYRHPSRKGTEPTDGLRGSLPCLGYQMEPVPQLVFLRPKGTLTPLHTLIAADQDASRQPLDVRFQLARSLSEAVLGVHVQGLVHKNIRTDTILVVEPPDPSGRGDESAGGGGGGGGGTKKKREAYLTNWHLLREASGATTMSGGTQWVQDIYRHPRRQGQHVQEKYNICHDIYSLGVCLLEIGLWEPLIRRPSNDDDDESAGRAPAGVSDLFKAAAGVAGAGADSDQEMRRKLRHPRAVQGMLIALARQNLPQRMGRGYCRLVVACLTVLDGTTGGGGGFRDSADVDWRAMTRTEQGVAFRDFILSFFADASVIFE
ncbi:hypothetical protein F4778DRAFT_447686 [Xylariomycetidae sp. FL2044]|nr:hypothetical protein F4778DRAFT_447686 [Xylariomycetidae sp. FL2044]